MSDIKIEANKRSNSNAKTLLNASLLPGVVYGPNFESMPIEINYQTFKKAYREAGQSKSIILDVDGKSVNVLIKSYTVHPVKNTFEHIDFIAYDENKEITTKVPVELYGQSEAVKLGGILSQKLHQVPVKCLVKDLPESFKASIDSLVESDSKIYVKDLENPNKVELLIEDSQIVAGIIIPRAITAAEAAEEEGETPEGEEGAEGGEKASEEGGDTENKGEEKKE